MSDFETRVREALTSGAEGAPAPVGLAEGARVRMRRRRRNATGMVTAAFLVAAVPVGFAVVNAGNGDGPGGSAGPEVAREGTDDGMVVYSYLDATVQVPDTWRSGGRYVDGDWCNGTKRPEQGPYGYVGVLDARTEMFCMDEEPLSNYEPFASFSTQRQGPLRVERGDWVTENLQVGRAWLTVRTDDEALLHKIQNSAEVIADTDPNGCTTTTPAMTDDSWRPEVVFDLKTKAPEIDEITACGHMNILSGNAGPTLSSSMSFTGGDARYLALLVFAQPGAAPTEEACTVSAASVWVLNVRAGEQVQQVLVRRDYCHGLGTDDGTTYRQDSYEVNAWLELGEPVQLPDDPDAPVSSGTGSGAPLDPDQAQAPDSQGGGSQGYAGE